MTPVPTAPGHGILVNDLNAAGRLVAVEILLRVTRGAGDRLDGSACISGATDVREFSGMLELMRVFEDLIPTQPSTAARIADPPPDGSPTDAR
jgi:hypothetical protein